MTQAPNNPYAAPQAELQSSRRSLRQLLVDGAAWSWLLVFLINLPFCLAFGWEVCSPEGRQGMLATLALMFVFSTWLVSTNPWFRVRMIIGGLAVAVSQFFPILQMITGVIGIRLVEFIGLMPVRKPNNDDVFFPKIDLNRPSAIFLTLFVGFVFMLFALAIGAIFRIKDTDEFLAAKEAADSANSDGNV